MKITINMELEIPRYPNFLRIKESKGTIDIGNLGEDAYSEFEDQFIEGLRKHWLQRKKEHEKTT